MYLTGFADEAAVDIDGQIRATQALGWKNIEARNINGRNIHDISEAEFAEVCDKLEKTGIRVNCFGSAIANWGKSIEEPFTSSLEEARRAIPRMQRLGTRMIRIMSFAVRKGRAPDDQMAEERFHRLRDFCRLFFDAGLMPVHENCMNYGGMGWPYTLELLERVPGLKLVFDTGNPVMSDDMTKPPPRPKQSSWEFYEHVRDHVVYVHVKDGIWDPEKQQVIYTFPGEGQGDVRRILKDLLRRGYDGGISIEPHMAVVAHDRSAKSKAELMFENYVEYGRRLMRLLDGIRAELEQERRG